jgi:hypothetical protein
MVGPTALAIDSDAEDLVNSAEHVLAADAIATDFFRNSEIFSMLNGEEVTAFIKDIGWKILSRAVCVRATRLGAAAPFKEASTSIEQEGSSPEARLPEPQPDIAVGQQPRIIYSTEEILGLRDKASPIEIIGTPVRQIELAIRHNMPRGYSQAPVFKTLTSPQAWQDFSTVNHVDSIAAPIPNWEVKPTESTETVHETTNLENDIGVKPQELPKDDAPGIQVGFETEIAAVEEPRTDDAADTIPLVWETMIATAQKPSKDDFFDVIEMVSETKNVAAQEPSIIDFFDVPPSSEVVPEIKMRTAQETDPPLRDTLISSVRDAKQQNHSRDSSMTSKTEKNVTHRGRHYKTNSDCDGLAKSFEGLKLEEREVRGIRRSLERSGLLANTAETKSKRLPPLTANNPSTPARPTLTKMLQVSTPAVSVAQTQQTPTLDSRLAAFKNGSFNFGLSPKTSRPSTQMPQKSSPLAPTVEKDTEHPNMPPETMPHVQSGAVKLVGISKPAEVSEPKSAEESNPAKVSKPVDASEPVKTSKPVEDPMPLHHKTGSSSLAAAPVTPPLSSGLPSQDTKKESTKQDLSAKSSSISTKPALVLDEISNKNVKGAGLSASKWAIHSTPVFSSRPRPLEKENSRTLLFKPPQTPNFNNAQPVPTAPVMPMVPVYQTVLVPDPQTGRYVEVMGLLKAGSVPVVAHMPAPQVASPPTQQTSMNFQPLLPTSPVNQISPFSRGLPGADTYFNPDTPPFRPSPGASTPRPPLSPVRQGDNVQAKLQSRLNRSFQERMESSPIPRRYS